MKQISVNELSLLSGVDRRTIAKRLSGLTPEQGPGKARLFPSDIALRAIFTAGNGLDLQQEQAALARERRRALELENGRREKTLLPADEVSEVWSHQVGIAKGRFLALPVRLAPSLLRCSALRDVETTLRDAIFDVLTELSGGESA